MEDGVSLERLAAASLLGEGEVDIDMSLPLQSEPVPVDHLDYSFVRSCKVSPIQV
jgi:hypothetical protein